jgi:diguanylate cyclase (GGDEF)-like protein
MTIMTPADHLMERATDCSIFERALDALPDGVLLVDADRKVVFMNPAFKRLWNMPVDAIASREDSRNLQFVMDQLVDAEGFRREVERLHATLEISQEEIALKDGRTIFRRSLPFQERENFCARIWIFTDVTEARNATIDHLTQMANRLAFSREFPSFVTAPSNGLKRAVAIIDIDHFKRFNDLYGHAKGDIVLSQIGAILKSHTRNAGDLAFRIGGEEFLMATRTRKTGEAGEFFESVRASVRAMNVQHEGNEPSGAVTISIGYGSFERPREPNSVFERADEALYQAKARGRNMVVEAVM